jgi:hypothetical protein
VVCGAAGGRYLSENHARRAQKLTWWWCCNLVALRGCPNTLSEHFVRTLCPSTLSEHFVWKKLDAVHAAIHFCIHYKWVDFSLTFQLMLVSLSSLTITTFVVLRKFFSLFVCRILSPWRIRPTFRVLLAKSQHVVNKLKQNLRCRDIYNAVLYTSAPKRSNF